MSGLSEADTHAKLVNPAIYKKGWTEDHIKREETTGAVDIIAGKARRRSRGRTDLTLRIIVTAGMQPVAVAVIEVKKDSLPPGHGLDQAKGYAKSALLNVRFVYSTNGHQFVEFDRDKGLTTLPRPMAEFPSPADLRARYEAAMGFSLEAPAAAPLLRPYKGGEGARRYYQDAAIRAVFEKVAGDAAAHRRPRALLSLATGTGKTFIAANLLRRLADAGQLKRALFLCDRDELRRQALGELTNYFGDAAREVERDAGGKNHARNAAIHVATYQTLGVDKDNGEESFLTEFYPPDHFSHIIIDECHRSAWGKWSKVLTMNPDAVQIGLTATPRRLTTTEDTPEARADAALSADNLAYFGEPVYEYEIAQAMEDGYLAACDVKLALVDLDARGLTAAEIIRRNPVDANTGRPLTPQEVAGRYEANSFEKTVILPDRVKAMCRDLFEQMLANVIHRGVDGNPLGPRQKTIVFCATDRHADLVAAVLAVADQFAKGGTDDLENVYIFQTPEVKKAGGLAALAQAGDPAEVIRETKDLTAGANHETESHQIGGGIQGNPGARRSNLQRQARDPQGGRAGVAAAPGGTLRRQGLPDRPARPDRGPALPHGASRSQAERPGSVHRQQEQGFGSVERAPALEPDDDPKTGGGAAHPPGGCAAGGESHARAPRPAKVRAAGGRALMGHRTA
jgi:type I restriction enzyme R subunit